MVEHVDKWKAENVDKNTDKIMERRRRTVNAEHVGLYFVADRRCSQPVDLSVLTLTLEPQLAVLIRLHCLKSTFSVLTPSPILTKLR